MLTICRIFVIYRPGRFFGSLGTALLAASFVPGIRFVALYLNGEGQGHIQSLILASILAGMGIQTLLAAVIAELLATNRKLLEDIRYTAKRSEPVVSANSKNTFAVVVPHKTEKPRAVTRS
jgi:hypothetical protein